MTLTNTIYAFPIGPRNDIFRTGIFSTYGSILYACAVSSLYHYPCYVLVRLLHCVCFVFCVLRNL